MEGTPRQFSTPEQEIEYLRQRIADRERQLLDRVPVIDQTDIETVGRQELKSYGSFTPKLVLDKDYVLSAQEVHQQAEMMSPSLFRA